MIFSLGNVGFIDWGWGSKRSLGLVRIKEFSIRVGVENKGVFNYGVWYYSCDLLIEGMMEFLLKIKYRVLEIFRYWENGKERRF